ncbi:MAG: aspartate aminotransferase family protein [Rhodothermales bacterium]|nr:aspartate aminotransferase family protein [Rhodothermales bacterium]MBO6778401.1 aspartate aminotransferase family protein [Rhodothermales bacterium]
MTELAHAARRAEAWLEALSDRPVAATASHTELKHALSVDLPEHGEAFPDVLEVLLGDAERGLIGSGSPRFFGWVIGGTHPAALAADWLTSAFDQNVAIYQTAPMAAVAEEIAGRWLKQLLGLPEEASFAMVTGCQMAHFTALAAARHRVLARKGVDVERDGLFAAPRVRVLTGAHRHESLIRALRFLGLGSDCVRLVDLDTQGRMDMGHLARVLDEEPDAPTILCLMAGDLNTGAADPFAEACALAHAAGAWVHVDGAFGLWMRAGSDGANALPGCELADSWATDGHKWLQLPFDTGFSFVRDEQAHQAAMTMTATYLPQADGAGRDPMRFNPEWSRRARGIVTYVALRCMGQEAIARIVDECCRHARNLVDGLGAIEGVEVVAPARMNQGLVRFLDVHGDHDAHTDRMIAAIQAEGTAWFGGTTWKGVRAMRISVCNYRTTDADVDATIRAVRRVVAG